MITNKSPEMEAEFTEWRKSIMVRWDMSGVDWFKAMQSLNDKKPNLCCFGSVCVGRLMFEFCIEKMVNNDCLYRAISYLNLCDYENIEAKLVYVATGGCPCDCDTFDEWQESVLELIFWGYINYWYKLGQEEIEFLRKKSLSQRELLAKDNNRWHRI